MEEASGERKFKPKTSRDHRQRKASSLSHLRELMFKFLRGHPFFRLLSQEKKVMKAPIIVYILTNPHHNSLRYILWIIDGKSNTQRS